jgi:hypothetical protein
VVPKAAGSMGSFLGLGGRVGAPTVSPRAPEVQHLDALD